MYGLCAETNKDTNIALGYEAGSTGEILNFERTSEIESRVGERSRKGDSRGGQSTHELSLQLLSMKDANSTGIDGGFH